MSFLHYFFKQLKQFSALFTSDPETREPDAIKTVQLGMHD